MAFDALAPINPTKNTHSALPPLPAATGNADARGQDIRFSSKQILNPREKTHWALECTLLFFLGRDQKG